MTETCRNRTPEPKEAEKSARLPAEVNEIDGSTAVCPSLKGTGGVMVRGKQNRGGVSSEVVLCAGGTSCSLSGRETLRRSQNLASGQCLQD